MKNKSRFPIWCLVPVFKKKSKEGEQTPVPKKEEKKKKESFLGKFFKNRIGKSKGLEIEKLWEKAKGI